MMRPPRAARVGDPEAETMSKLEIRLLGGFDARLDGRQVTGFESQKVRGLLAYLALSGGKSVSRERLADLLWAEKGGDAARRNLRQATHNLRSAFAAAGGDGLLSTTYHELRLDPEREIWVDVEQFEQALRRGFTASGPDPYQLTVAARLYNGDLLAGFFIKDSPPFEEWLVDEQERLREAAIETYRTLIDVYRARGEHRMGIQYARRLLAVDPLSERAHRDLMELFALTGRRNRALAHFEKLRNLLNDELGVEPLEETTALYQSILVQDLPAAEEEADEAAEPLIPMVGRREALADLQREWQAVLDGGGRMTLIAGEAGIGKTRLMKSFVDAATSQRRAIVLRGRSYADAPLLSYGPFEEIAVNALAEVLSEDHDALAQRMSAESRGDLLALAPSLAETAPRFAAGAADAERPGADRVAESFLRLLAELGPLLEDSDTEVPAILMIDDLQWSDAASLDLLAEIVARLTEAPVWVVAGLGTGGSAPPHPLLAATAAAPDGEPRVSRLELRRLDPDAVHEVASTLVGIELAEELAGFLVRHARGLPLAVAELVNFLWDTDRLQPRGAGRWSLQGDLESTEVPESLEELILRRVRRLPTSARRLLSIAAVYGQTFDAEVVQAADGEHIAVVEICVQLMLEKWLIRQAPTSWSDTRRERDVVLWARGARRGAFDFAHEAIREAILSEVNPLRRQVMHRAVATALRAARADDPEGVGERLAYHYLAAAEWAEALPFLERAAADADRRGAPAAAIQYAERALAAIDRILAGRASAAEREDLAKRRERLAARAGRGAISEPSRA